MTLLTDSVTLVWHNGLYICIVLLISRLVYNRYKNGLSDIPGPILASLTDLWLLCHCLRGKSHEDYKLHDKYKSPLLRLGPNTISVADPEAVKVIYGWKPVFNKSRLYLSQYVTTEKGQVLTNMSSTRDEDWHARLRRPVAHTYSLSTLIEYEPLVDSTSAVFFQQVEERFEKTGQECPLHKWLQMYAFDIIGDLTFSKRFGFLEAGSDLNNLIRETGKAMDYIGFVGHLPTADEYLRLKGFGHLLRKFRPTGPIMKFTAQQIRAHRETKDESRPDFLTRFFKAREKYPDIMTDGQLATYANTNVSAGSDTSAIALREIVYRLLTHDGAYEKFMAELKTTLSARTTTTTTEPKDDTKHETNNQNHPITWAESQRMLYFQAFIKECLRLHPALGQLLPRDVPAGGVVLCGRFIPGGTVVGCNAWTVHRSKKLYGADARSFRPERWLDPDGTRADVIRQMENLSLAFGGGPRVCIGKNIAMLEISKFVPEFFRRFEVSLVDPRRYGIVTGWLVVQNGLDVKLRKRGPGEMLLD